MINAMAYSNLWLIYMISLSQCKEPSEFLVLTGASWPNKWLEHEPHSR